MYLGFLNIAQIFPRVSCTLDIILWLGRLRQEIKGFKASLGYIGRLFKSQKKGFSFKVLLFFFTHEKFQKTLELCVCLTFSFILWYFQGLCCIIWIGFFGLKNSHCMLYNTYHSSDGRLCSSRLSVVMTMLLWIRECRYVLRLSC